MTEAVICAGRVLGALFGTGQEPAPDAAQHESPPTAPEAEASSQRHEQDQMRSTDATPAEVPQQAQQAFEISADRPAQHGQHATDHSAPADVPQSEPVAMRDQQTTTAPDSDIGTVRRDLGSQPSSELSEDVDWTREQDVERAALAAGQQLAKDNSQALREVKQAMQDAPNRHDAQPQEEQELQDETNWSNIQQVERDALAAGRQLARDSSQALREVRQAVQEGNSFPLSVLLSPNRLAPCHAFY